MTFVRIIRQASRGGEAPIVTGNGSPEGVVARPVGWAYVQLDQNQAVHPWWIKRQGGATALGWRRLVGFGPAAGKIVLSNDSDGADLPSNTLALGGGLAGEPQEITRWRFGPESGWTQIGAVDLLLYFMSAESANEAAARAIVESSRGRGSGAGGTILFRCSVPGASGATLHPQTDVLELSNTQITAHKPINALGGVIGASGEPHERSNAIVQLIKVAGAATIDGIGMASPVVTGGSNGDLGAGTTFGRWVNMTTTATIGNVAGFGPSNTGFYAWRPDATVRVKLGAAITSLRVWVALTSATLSGKSTPTTEAVAGFRYATDVDGTAFWRCVSHDGGTTPLVTVTTVAVAADAIYTLRVVRLSNQNLEFYINGTLVATHVWTGLPNAGLPTDGQAHNISVTVTTLVAVAKALRFQRAVFVFADLP